MDIKLSNARIIPTIDAGPQLLFVLKNENPFYFYEAQIVVGDIEPTFKPYDANSYFLNVIPCTITNTLPKEVKFEEYTEKVKLHPEINIENKVLIALQKIEFVNEKDEKEIIEFLDDKLDWQEVHVLKYELPELELFGATIEIDTHETEKYKKGEERKYLSFTLKNNTDFDLQECSLHVVSQPCGDKTCGGCGIDCIGIPFNKKDVDEDDSILIHSVIEFPEEIETSGIVHCAILDYTFKNKEKVTIPDSELTWFEIEVEHLLD